MIAGYISSAKRVFCTECWQTQAAEGARPSQVLQTEEPDDPGDNFWIVDACEDCGRQVKYKAVTALN